MSFFEKAESQTVSPRERERRPVLPPWYGPAPGSLPGQSTQQVVAFKTSEAVLRLRHFDVYPAGFLFSLSLHLREPSEGHFDMPWELSDRQRRMPDGSLPDSFLRIGFELEDGSTWTNFNTDPVPSRNETPSGPVVLGRGGGGGDDEWEMDYWFWPLPDDGDIVVHASWPQYGIEEVSAVIDCVSLRTAATESETPWQ